MDDTGEPPFLDGDGRQQLHDLVARMERHQGPWGTWTGGDQTGPNRFMMTWVREADVVNDARSFLYDHHLAIRFAWSEWDEGRAIFRDPAPGRFERLDRMTVLMLLTAVVRNDRFSEGAWRGQFEDGDGIPLFRRLLELETAAR